MTHPIPIEALEADIAVLGKKGGGKTFTSKGIVERLLDLGRRVLVLDPLGVWAGLRTGADGVSPGYPIAIFGGAHADLPLDPAAAGPLAAVIARENLPAVIDLSELSKGAQQAFLLKFLQELRRANNEALTIVLEEADVFAPQNPLGDDSKALHAEIDWIARRGRFRGFRLIVITQRPARLSKDVLTQCSTLIVHRLPAPQDRDAVKAWVEGNGDREKVREVFDTLSALAVGEAWLYAPELDILDRVRFPAIKTLDTSSTPKAGEKRIEPKTLAQVDVSAIRAALEKAKPAVEPGKRVPTVPAVDLDAAEQRGYQRGLAEGIERGKSTGIALGVSRAQSALASLRVPDILAGDAAALAGAQLPIPPVAAPASVAPKEIKPRKAQASLGKIGPAAEKLLAALCHYPAGLPSWADVCIVAGMTHGNGYFYGGRKALTELGLAVEVDGAVSPTAAGLDMGGGASQPLSLADFVALWSPKLRAPGSQMLDYIARVGACTPAQLAEATGIKPGNGYWYGGIAAVRDVGLVVADKARIALAPLLQAAKDRS